MKNIIISIALLSVLYSCDQRKPARENIKNGDYTIEFLFEYDSCRMYRFDDGRRYVYWCNCKGKINADYETTYSTGKTTYQKKHKEETIITSE